MRRDNTVNTTLGLTGKSYSAPPHHEENVRTFTGSGSFEVLVMKKACACATKTQIYNLHFQDSSRKTGWKVAALKRIQFKRF